MSAWHSEIREEGVKWACFAEGGVRDPRMDHFMAASYQEARDWVDAAYIRKTTPKVKKPPVYVSELDDLATMLPDGLPHDGGAEAAPVPADEPDAAPAASPVAETATDDQAGSAGAPKRRGRPPKVSARWRKS